MPLTRPCLCDRHRPGFPWAPGDCVLCWTWHNRDGFRAALGHAGTPDPPRVEGGRATAAPGPSPVACRQEGPVVTWAPCRCEAKHVRQCLHDGGPDLCVRGPSANPAVRSCAGCPLRSVGEE